jgi:arogenate dehydrogenase (NADP+)
LISLNEKRIAVIGLGLIGGSLALNLAAQGAKIIGFVKNKFDFTNAPFELVTQEYEHLKTCDLIFICTPLNKITRIIEEVQPYLKTGALLTDVGSVKDPICRAATKIMRHDCHFVGGHPMAGTEKSGFANAFPELFKGRPWALVPPSPLNSGNNTESNLNVNQELLKQAIECTGAKLVLTDAQKHDKAVALISHLPLLLSLGLLNAVNNLKDAELKELALILASSGFEGMVRLAKGNPELNRDLLQFNRKQVQEAFEAFLSESKSLLG